MNYIHAEDSIVIEYPYSIEKMRSDNPQTSFPTEMSTEELAEWGVFAVEEQNPPAFNEQTESIELQPPSLVNGVWLRNWQITPVEPVEIERRTTSQAVLQREERNRVLSLTDFTQCLDFPGTENERAAYTIFRQALRDVPVQTGFPWNVVWPIPPGAA
jgi:hypothetical protein